MLPSAINPTSSTPLTFDAAVFDMDGVITDTASVHSRAWKQMFDEYLGRRAASPLIGAALARSSDSPFREFSPADYRTYVDGRPRYAGVDAFLRSRDIELPWGTPTDPAGSETVCGLGNRKNVLFNEVIATDGVKVYPSSLALIHALRGAGVRVGLATSSRNAALILEKTQTLALFGTVVDGLVAERQGLKGKPQPDIFIAASANLGAARERTIVIEDAVSGVQAGARGGFALVIGVAREDNAHELRDNGADVVVRDLAEIDLAGLDAQVRAKQEAVR